MVTDFDNIQIFSRDFPIKETILWDKSEISQVKLHAEYVKMVIWWKFRVFPHVEDWKYFWRFLGKASETYLCCIQDYVVNTVHYI